MSRCHTMASGHVLGFRAFSLDKEKRDIHIANLSFYKSTT
jgi:hypothetical protein